MTRPWVFHPQTAMVRDLDRRPVAYVTGKDLEEMHTNGHRIAASQEMLEVLINMVGEISILHDFNNLPDGLRKPWANARAVIAKAKGEA